MVWKWTGKEFLLATILGTEVISDVDSDVNDINLHSVNIVNKLENSSMKNLHVNCLDQLILVVHLPDVSVTTTNDYHCLL